MNCRQVPVAMIVTSSICVRCALAESMVAEGMTSDKWHDVLEIHRSLGKTPQSHSDAVAVCNTQCTVVCYIPLLRHCVIVAVL